MRDLRTWQHIRLVARREVTTRGGSKSFLISTALTVAGVVAMVVVPAVFFSDSPTEWELGVVGPVPEGFEETLQLAVAAQDAEVTVVHLPDDADAEAATADDELDAVLVGGEELVADEEPPDGLVASVGLAVSQTRLMEQLAAAGLDPEQAAAAVDITPVEVRTSEDGGDDDTSGAMAFIGVVVLFIAINSYGAWVLTGVLEEKSSRVVELIVAAMPARALLAGKVLGIGLLGIGQLLLVGAAGVTAALLVDVADVPSAVLPSLGWLVLWFVLGFSFYAVGYATAGSLVSRQEDAQSASSPLVYVVLAAYFVTLGVIAPNPESTASRILSQLPPVAPMAMPARITQGEAAPWEVALSIVLMLLAIWGMVRLAGRIYESSLLRSGARIKLLAAIRDSREARRTAHQAG
ncbi:ABC transporter permease [Actinomarinicola tropica]|uniref:ABC transporter permease n=1 Tax=Actinomarinicola tropica TaxID=2789776 RepID=UPI001896FE4E|nr:ABC transporter permease [Actinomarinicola tropica]